MTDRNVVITGMMGSGKSTVAAIVAKNLGKTFLDTDVEIENRVGKKIADIFASLGEAAFRKAEADLCDELSKKSGLVIATGGGFLVPLASQKKMSNHSVFCLDASLETLLARTTNSAHRPLTARMDELLTERREAYQRIFHHIDTNNKNAADIAQEIVNRFKLDETYEADRIRMVCMPHQSPYPIFVKDGVACEIFARLEWAGIQAKRLIVITNEKLKSLVGQNIKGEVEWLTIPEGEKFKSLETVYSLYDDLIRLKTKRDDVLVALGGGVVGDVAGFVAATFMRGITLVQIPTTLLAMVDSSIGGKTGVDLPQGKNLIGAFKQPLMVLTDPSLLKTLDKEEFSAGMAEVIKHAIISDDALFEQLEQKQPVDLQDLIFRALLVKAKIVEEDPFEQGRRSLLNLGHTFGHAFETVSGYSMRHGEAVAVGLVAACELSHHLGLCNASVRSRVERVLSHHNLPVRLPPNVGPANAIYEAFSQDKKATGSGLRFIVLHGLSDVREMFVNDRQMLLDVFASVATSLA